jgi:DNA repair exonuclease SbcCD ATPase subunit
MQPFALPFGVGVMRAVIERSLFAAILAASLAIVPMNTAGARDTDAKGGPEVKESQPALVNPNDDFVKEFSNLKKQLQELGKKIKQSAAEIETLTSPDAARKEIGTLQALIADTLGLVTNNADVAKLGEKVIDFARKKQKQFEQDKKFSPEERAYLQKEWKRVGAETEAAIGELTKARSKLTGMLKTVQARGDFIEELQALKNANKMLDVVRSLASELRAASGSLESFAKAAKPPSAGM